MACCHDTTTCARGATHTAVATLLIEKLLPLLFDASAEHPTARVAAEALMAHLDTIWPVEPDANELASAAEA